jgi:hypothetical protein
MTVVSLDSAVAFAANAAIEAGTAMEAAFSSARSGDRDGALAMAKEAAAKAVLAKKVLATALRSQNYAAYDASRTALGHAEDARLFAKAAMDVTRSAVRSATMDRKTAGEAGKRVAEVMAFLMAAASVLLDIKRGSAADSALRKVAAAAERAGQAAEEVAKASPGSPMAEDAKAAKDTAAEIARRSLWAAKDMRRGAVKDGDASGR